jgi:hypothetical protein
MTAAQVEQLNNTLSQEEIDYRERIYHIGADISPIYIGDYLSTYQAGCVCKIGDIFYCFNGKGKNDNNDDSGLLYAFNLSTNKRVV